MLILLISVGCVALGYFMGFNAGSAFQKEADLRRQEIERLNERLDKLKEKK